jgi:glycosyltransferase involved in cell wall biosynthesis
MQKPVIACGTGGVPEIITHGRDGWLVEERSGEAVAAAVSTLLNDGELCRQLGQRARETVRNRFTPRQQATAVTRRYASLIAAA